MRIDAEVAGVIGLAMYLLLGTLALLVPGLVPEPGNAYLFQSLLVFAPALVFFSIRLCGRVAA